MGLGTYRPLVGGVVWLGLLGSLEGWLAERRPLPPELKGGSAFVVTSSADDGPGSLRNALFAADRSPTRARVEVRTNRIVLATPLPPLVNPQGMVVDAPGAGCDIDARAIATGPVLDLAAPHCLVRGVRIRGAAGQGILVRSPGARLRNVGLSDCGDGVYLADGVDDLEVEDSTFTANATGIHLPAGAAAVLVRNNVFRKHEQAGVWAVAPGPSLAPARGDVTLRANRFEGDRIAVVLIHVPARVEGNTFLGSTEAAVYLTGGGVIRGNRIHEGIGLGILADLTEEAVIEDNELSQNVAVGIMLRDSRSTLVQRNKVHGNGYGIVTVLGDRGRPVVLADNQVLSQLHDGLYVLAGAPLLRGNQALRNRGAGLRVLDLIPLTGPRVTAAPQLQDNVMSGNGQDIPVRDEYRVRAEEEEQPR
jgi:parallel beta-helix repeat protein